MNFAEEVSSLLDTTGQIAEIRAQRTQHSGAVGEFDTFLESAFQLPEEVAEELNTLWGDLRREVQIPSDPEGTDDKANSSNPADRLRLEVTAVTAAHNRLIDAHNNREIQRSGDGPGLPWKKALSWAKTVFESILSLLKLSKRARAILTVIGEGFDLAKA